MQQHIVVNIFLQIPAWQSQKPDFRFFFPLSRLTPAAPNADGLRIIDPVHFIETLEREYAS